MCTCVCVCVCLSVCVSVWSRTSCVIHNEASITGYILQVITEYKKVDITVYLAGCKGTVKISYVIQRNIMWPCRLRVFIQVWLDVYTILSCSETKQSWNKLFPIFLHFIDTSGDFEKTHFYLISRVALLAMINMNTVCFNWYFTVGVREMLESAGFYENIPRDQLFVCVHDAVLMLESKYNRKMVSDTTNLRIPRLRMDNA